MPKFFNRKVVSLQGDEKIEVTKGNTNLDNVDQVKLYTTVDAIVAKVAEASSNTASEELTIEINLRDEDVRALLTDEAPYPRVDLIPAVAGKIIDVKSIEIYCTGGTSVFNPLGTMVIGYEGYQEPTS